ncbi:MAG TPA: AsmA family protein [Rhizomicrobium sp.]
MVERHDTRSGFETARERLSERWTAFWAHRRERARAEETVLEEKGANYSHASGPPALGALKWAGGTLVLLTLLVLIFFDWNMLRGPLARYASHRLHRTVQIQGNLHVHLWSWTPRVDVGGIRVANTKWAGGGDMAKIGHLAVSVKLWPLLGGHIRLPLVDLEHSSFLVVRNMEGHSNWEFDKTAANKPLKLPAINHFIIKDGHLKIDDARKKMHFVGIFSSSESTIGQGQGFALSGDGTLNGEKFTADAHGAPLLNVNQAQPYPFTLNMHAGYTRVTARGQITHPFDLGALNVTASFSGRDAADLYYLTGLVLPNTPHYEASAHITRDDEMFRIADLTGRMGHSDLSGDLTVDTSGDKPLVTGDLHSRRVYSDDMSFLFGGRIATPAPASTRAAAASAPGIGLAGDTHPVAQSTLLLPDAPLDVDRVRQMNANVHYSATAIVSSDFPLRSLRVHVRLHDGVLRLDPLEAGLAMGTVSGHVKLDASRKVPVTHLDLRLRDIRLQSLVHPVRGQATIEGPLEARAILTAAGDSIHRAASNANGSVTFVIPHGQMRRAFAELLGINLLNGGVALLTGDQSQTNIRCAIASFQARDGLLNANQILLDTDVERGNGRGYINLKNETLNMVMSGDAKSFRILRMNAPITLTGSLSHPKVGVQASHALAQGGIAVALGALINPIASLIATIDPGLAKDANCGAVIAEAKQKGAPVTRRAAARTPMSQSERSRLLTTPTAEHVARRSSRPH